MAEGLQALTERERETLRLLLGGHDIKSIATRLDLSVHTVNERLREARRKLGVSSSRQAARLLADEGEGPQFSADMKTGVVAPTAGAEHSTPPSRSRGRSLIWLSGGVLIMSSIIAAVVAVTMLQTAAAPSPPPPTLTPGHVSGRIIIVPAKTPDPEALAAARHWLGLIDGQHWDESWDGVGGVVTAQMAKASWNASIQEGREEFGAVSSRKFRDVGKATELPGAPKGDYEIIQFTTNFARKPKSIERVTLAHEPAGWKVIGYYVIF